MHCDTRELIELSGASMGEPIHTVTLTPPEKYFPAQTKWDREYRAFCRLLPQLLATERGKYVAVHEERVIDSDSDDIALMMRVIQRIGNVDFHVGLVTDEVAPVQRSGVVRDLSASVAK